jgi:hypothetical protein
MTSSFPRRRRDKSVGNEFERAQRGRQASAHGWAEQSGFAFVILSGAKDLVPYLASSEFRRSGPCLPDLKPWVSAYRRVTFWQQRQKVTKKRRPRSWRRSIAEEEARWIGALRVSLVAGSADGPSMARHRTLRHPASPRANKRAGKCRHELRCSAPATGDQLLGRKHFVRPTPSGARVKRKSQTKAQTNIEVVGRAKRFRLQQFAFDFPVPSAAPSTGARGGHWPARAVRAGRGRMPKRPMSGHGWPVSGPRHERGARGTGPARFFFCAGPATTLGTCSFGYFSCAKKSDPPVGGNPRLQTGKADPRPSEARVLGLWRCNQRYQRTLRRSIGKRNPA